jgi:aspartate/methionine/tyrosine aminotransferase
MWFTRMSLEEWFDKYQYRTRFNIGESSVGCLKVRDLGIDLADVELRYGHHAGHPALRDLIAQEYDGLSAGHVLVTSGAAEAIFAIAASLLQPGDEVVVEHPNYPSTYEVPRAIGCRVRLLRLKFEQGFVPDLDRLDALVSPRTKLLVFTHPNNPTGSMMTRGALDRLVAFAESRRIHLLFDETYRHFTYGPPLPPAASLSPMATSVCSMSKCYGLPGIRIGWLATRDQHLLDGVLAVREQVSISNAALSEKIAIAVLSRREHFTNASMALIRANLATVSSWMAAQPGLTWVPPQGGVVALPRITMPNVDDPEPIYRDLAESHGVFVIPGRCFELENRFFRLGFGGSPEELSGGLERVGSVLAALKQAATG